jgi:hypothetical protein
MFCAISRYESAHRSTVGTETVDLPSCHLHPCCFPERVALSHTGVIAATELSPARSLDRLLVLVQRLADVCGIDLAQAVQTKVSNKTNSDPSLLMFPPPTEAADRCTGASGAIKTGATPGGLDPSNRNHSLSADDRLDVLTAMPRRQEQSQYRAMGTTRAETQKSNPTPTQGRKEL